MRIVVEATSSSCIVHNWLSASLALCFGCSFKVLIDIAGILFGKQRHLKTLFLAMWLFYLLISLDGFILLSCLHEWMEHSL